MEGDEFFLPLSGLNAFVYCPRRFYYEHVFGEMEVNAAVLEGRLLHERVDTAGTEQDGDLAIHRRVYVYSRRLRVAGFVDLVEVTAGGIIPVEYKRGQMGKWGNDRVQLCAQALCLEERTGRSIPQGLIFHHASRRREVVALDEGLRAQTEAVIEEAHRVALQARIPVPVEDRRRCRPCSLQPICLPDEVITLCAEPGDASAPNWR